ncbi:MAG: enoyl-CoA hydratase/isomerase family protein [Solirubrobacteraceae bacterium]
METVLRERLEPGIEVLRLNRPERRNALDSATLELLVSALRELAVDPSVRVVVLSSTSVLALCAGIDVGEPLDHDGGIRRMETFVALYAAIENLPMPLVCVCFGHCVGGGAELVTSADLRVGATNLGLRFVGARLGVPIGVARLVPLVGLSRAKELVFSGHIIRVDEARTLGLLARVAEPEDAEAVALRLAREVAAHSTESVRRYKAIFREFERSQSRVERENQILLEFQREGDGLPSGPVDG